MKDKYFDMMIGICGAICIILIAAMLSGCSAIMGQGDYEHYTAALVGHSEAEATRVSNQAATISEITALSGKAAQTPTEAALQAAIAMMVIGNLHPVSLDIKKPTTGMDVAQSAVGQIPFVTMGAAMYRLGAKGIESAGNVTVGANSSVTDSLNRVENHALGYGSNATAQGTVPVPVQVVQPEVIIP